MNELKQEVPNKVPLNRDNALTVIFNALNKRNDYSLQEAQDINVSFNYLVKITDGNIQQDNPK